MATVYFSDELLVEIYKKGYSKPVFVREAIEEKLEREEKPWTVNIAVIVSNLYHQQEELI